MTCSEFVKRCDKKQQFHIKENINGCIITVYSVATAWEVEKYYGEKSIVAIGTTLFGSENLISLTYDDNEKENRT